jgi:hypothetical protein
LLGSINKQLSGLSVSIGTQSISSTIKPYNGDPKGFVEWIRAVEKFGTLTSASGLTLGHIAYQTAQGPVSDFLARYIETNPDALWPQIKIELRARFAEVTDLQYALTLLRNMRQTKSESVQVFAERILRVSDEAGFADHNTVEGQLIGYFTDGLLSDQLKMKILRDKPNTLQEAVRIAMNEQNLYKTFNLRYKSESVRREEPMEIGRGFRNFRPRKMFGRRNINMLDSDIVDSRPNKHMTRSWSYPIICYHCGLGGHIKRICPQLMSGMQQTSNKNSLGTSQGSRSQGDIRQQEN